MTFTCVGKYGRARVVPQRGLWRLDGDLVTDWFVDRAEATHVALMFVHAGVLPAPLAKRSAAQRATQ
jgi:hypothetical protein